MPHHTGGMQPGQNPKQAWGHYAPAYDPATDPWHQDDDEDDRSPRLPQPGQATRMGGDPKPLIYTVPAAPNQWGYTLTYHPLLQQHSSGSHQQGGQSQQQPASAAQTGTQIQQPAQQEAARTLQPLPESTPLTAAEGDDVTWKEVAHLVGLREEDDESEWERVLQVKQHATASGGAGDPRRRRDGAAAATAAAEEEAEEDEGNMLHWDGLFNYMMISPGGADRPETFPPELPFHADAEMHLRGLPHGAWAGITLPWKSRRGPEYTSSTRGFCRIKVRRRPGGVEPSGYMATSTAFVLFPWGRIQGGRPNKWLLHITERSERPPQEDADATQLQPGSSYTLEMPPGARTWQLGRLQPRLALQYYYDWGNMMGTGAIYDRLPRASNNPPLAWEQMALQLIPPRDDRESRTDDGGQRDPDEEEDDEPSFMQRSTQLDDTAASSGGQAPQSQPRPERQQRGTPQRMAPAAAMVRRWLRQLAAVLYTCPMGDAIPLLVEEAMEVVGTCTDDDRWQDDRTVGGPGPCKKRRTINILYVARRRLQLICEDEGMDGYNQHQTWEDLKTALGELRQGQAQFQLATRGQGGHQVLQGGHGLEQAIAAVETAMSATTEGDLDWATESWSQALDTLVQEAEDLLEEESQLDFVHPADVVALAEGGQEAPPLPQGEPLERTDLLLRNIKAVMHFVPAGGAQVTQLLAAILVWRQQQGGESIAVDTQTTDAGGDDSQAAPPAAQTGTWIPSLTTEQWPSSVPSSTAPSDSQQGDPFEPTDAELVEALEEFERREQEEALQSAGDPTESRDEADLKGGDLSDPEHRRRRVLASLFDDRGNPDS
ncbi:unnamed protein product [Symbiodinium microadriaticum]|nr:unnamed protein product [Symbiodinium microadriaticum]CAE7571704.1 unnamed protein product [Symbiodinium sp. KB8]